MPQENMLIQVDRATQKPVAEHAQTVQTNQCVFNWSGNRLFVTTGEGHVNILQYPSFETDLSLNAHTSSCFALSMSPSGEYLAVGGGDALVSLWDTQEWICVRTLDLVDSPVKSVDFSFDGSYIVAGSEDEKRLQIAHVDSGEIVYSVDRPQPAAMVAWHPFRYALAYSADKDGLKIIGGMN